MSAKSEQEIIDKWKYMRPPLVSICCIAYNHELYINNAIEGFLMQETDFPFEIIIHDDASTDRTAYIIREYQKAYPKLIKTIFQKENQYSKGVMISPSFVWPKAQGKYIALCEGDDYWTVPYKLQTQLAEMFKHPECDISFHPSYFEYMDFSRPNKANCQHRQKTCIIPLREIIHGGGGFCPTASLIIKKKVLDNMPEWFTRHAPVGDFFIQIYGSKKAGALYIEKPMSVYRAMAPNSWSSRASKINSEMLNDMRKYLYCLDTMKEDFKLDLHPEIDRIKSLKYYLISILFLRNKIYDQFQKYITKSHNTFPQAKIKQLVIYRLKKLPFIIYSCDKFIVAFRKILSHGKAVIKGCFRITYNIFRTLI